MTEVMDFETFAALHGAGQGDYHEPGLHRLNSSVSQAARQRALNRLEMRIAENAKRRAALRAQYDQLVDAGELRPPTAQEDLERIAAGHPANEATQAAIRVLQRRATRRASQERSEP